LAPSNVGTAITQRSHTERSFGRDGSLSGRAAHSEMVDQTSQPVANAIHSRSKIGTLRRSTVDSALRSNHEVSFGMECRKNDMESHSKMVDTTSRAVGNAIGNITRFEIKNQLVSYRAVEKQSSQPVGIAIHPRSITAGSSRSACSLSGRASHREMVDHTSQTVGNAIHSRAKEATMNRCSFKSSLPATSGNDTRLENMNNLVSYSAVDKQSSQPVGIAIHPRSVTAGSSRSVCSLSGMASHSEMVHHTSRTVGNAIHSRAKAPPKISDRVERTLQATDDDPFSFYEGQDSTVAPRMKKDMVLVAVDGLGGENSVSSADTDSSENSTESFNYKSMFEASCHLYKSMRGGSSIIARHIFAEVTKIVNQNDERVGLNRFRRRRRDKKNRKIMSLPRVSYQYTHVYNPMMIELTFTFRKLPYVTGTFGSN